MTDRDQPVIFSMNRDNAEPDQLGVYDDFAATENRPADFATGLVNLGFLAAAIGRGKWFVFIMVAVGLLVGVGVAKAFPKHYQASASLLMTLSPFEDAETAPTNDQAMAETHSVAQLALNQLGLHQSVSSFLGSYTVTAVTDRVLTVTASGPSSDQAVLRANAVASAFLKFRASELQAEQNLMMDSLNQQVNQANQRLNTIDAQISQASSQSQHSGLRAEQITAANTLSGLQQGVTNNQTTTQPALAAALKGSVILSVSPLPHSKLKGLVEYAAFGLLGGLVVALVIIIIRALVSDRLRQRDDIAYVLEAPVRLSVGRVNARRWLPARPGRAAKRELDMRRIVTRLQSAVPRSIHGPAGLAIIAVDNAPIAAQAVVALAAAYASQGHQVVAADLSRGTHMAHLLRVKHPGAHAVSQNGVSFTVAVPDPDDPAPVGPLRTVTATVPPAQTGDTLFASYASADVLLTLVTLDPALGAENLATWATSAVVMVSAGQSTAQKIYGVGEMIRLAGTRLDSVVVIGADKGDESLGLTPSYSRATV